MKPILSPIDRKGKAAGVNKEGIPFHLASGESVFTKTVPFDDGTTETFQRRERPSVYTKEKSEFIALFTRPPFEGGPDALTPR